MRRVQFSLAVTLLAFAAHLAAETPVTIAPRPAVLDERIGAALKAKGPGYRPRTEHLLPDGGPRYTNRLILEDSPYLIQHAHNPVDWYAWGVEAFDKAKRENKPVFLSIGYSTCHWCHVMERESFENPAIANFLNRHFVAVKVDRERRPDLDETYMTAVQLIAGRGGWPMSSFLTPEGKPFFGGTYYPAEQFLSLLTRIAGLWDDERAALSEQAERIAGAVAEAGRHKSAAGKVGREAIQAAVKQALARHDELQGGFGPAPKFPRESLLILLLAAVERHPAPALLAAIETTLNAMARGGIYDQVGGGFHRYATDHEWLVPHFEKMLYNQAQLARVYLLAWRLTGDETLLRGVTAQLDTLQHAIVREDRPANPQAGSLDWAAERLRRHLWMPAWYRSYTGRDTYDYLAPGISYFRFQTSPRWDLPSLENLHSGDLAAMRFNLPMLTTEVRGTDRINLAPWSLTAAMTGSHVPVTQTPAFAVTWNHVSWFPF